MLTAVGGGGSLCVPGWWAASGDRATVWTVARELLSTADLQARTLKRGEKVRFVSDLPGIAAGTEGKVAMANGFAWHRYWIRLGNGQVVGHVDHSALVRSKNYGRYMAARAQEAGQALSSESEKAADKAGNAAEIPAGEDVVVNGATIPGYLLARSAAARARLGA